MHAAFLQDDIMDVMVQASMNNSFLVNHYHHPKLGIFNHDFAVGLIALIVKYIVKIPSVSAIATRKQIYLVIFCS